MTRNQTIEKIVFAAILTSMAVLIKIIFYYIPIADQFKRIELYLVLIILSGILLGPVYGAMVGFSTDMIYMILYGGDFIYVPIHVIAGLIPGIIFYFLPYNKRHLALTILIVKPVYFLLSTTALWILLGWEFNNWAIQVPRLIRTAFMMPIYFLLIHTLVTDQRFSSFSIYKSFLGKKNDKLGDAIYPLFIGFLILLIFTIGFAGSIWVFDLASLLNLESYSYYTSVLINNGAIILALLSGFVILFLVILLVKSLRNSSKQYQ